MLHNIYKETRFLEWGHQEVFFFFPLRETIPFFPAMIEDTWWYRNRSGSTLENLMPSQEGEKASPSVVPETHSPGWPAGSNDAGHTDFWAHQQRNRSRRRLCSAVAPRFWSAGQALMAMYYVQWASLACSRKLPGFVLSRFQRLYSFPRAAVTQSHHLKTKRYIFSHSSGCEKFKIKESAGLCSEDSREGSFLSFSSFWCCPAMLGTP